MKTTIVLAAAAAAVVAPPPVSEPTPAPAPQYEMPPARIPGFAATLSELPGVSGPDAWTFLSEAEAWAALGRAQGEGRQRARWAYAKSLIGQGYAAEASGVLEVMASDDPDLALVDSFRLARGVAYASLGRTLKAMEWLAGPSLATNPEACAWRMLALGRERLWEQALREFACARPALLARPLERRAPFLLTASSAAVAAGKAENALRLLAPLGKTPAADLVRVRAHLALGQDQHARLVLGRVAKNGNVEQRLEAELSQIEAEIAAKRTTPASALKKLEHIRYVWRGGQVEERALRLSHRLASQTGDLRAALSAGSTLFRYFELGPEAGPLMLDLQRQLAAALDPASRMPIDQAAGLYWDFRDLTPLGADGDLLVSRLGERLQMAGLYGRAADLFEHQLFARAKDLTQGPLSAKVARLHILAGRPERALDAIRRTSSVPFPTEMLVERRRVEAVALSQLGRAEEALALLDNVPGSEGLRAEILWKRRDWNGLAAAIGQRLPQPASLNEVDQANLLRLAIALAMSGREGELQALGARYGAAFEKLPSGSAFAALTAGAGAVNGDALAKAMANIPSASPAGDIADLLEVTPVAAVQGP